MAVEVKEIESEIKNEIEVFRGEISGIVVDCDEAYEYAGEMVLKAKSILKEIESKFKEPVSAAYRAHKAIKDLQNDLERPVKSVVTELQKKVNDYVTEKERVRREEQAKMEAERRRKEEEEKERIRKEAEAKKEAARAAEKEGKTEEAVELLEEAAEIESTADSVFVMPEIPMQGIETAKKMDLGSMKPGSDVEIKIVDMAAFIHAVAERGSFELIEVKDGAVKRFVKGAGIKEFPGLEIKEVTKVQFTAAR